MSTSLIRLSICNEIGEIEETEWRFAADGRSLSDAAQEGCRRLQLENRFTFFMYKEVSSANGTAKRKFLLPDEIVKAGTEYTIVNERLHEAIPGLVFYHVYVTVNNLF